MRSPSRRPTAASDVEAPLPPSTPRAPAAGGERAAAKKDLRPWPPFAEERGRAPEFSPRCGVEDDAESRRSARPAGGAPREVDLDGVLRFLHPNDTYIVAPGHARTSGRALEGGRPRGPGGAGPPVDPGRERPPAARVLCAARRAAEPARAQARSDREPGVGADLGHGHGPGVDGEADRGRPARGRGGEGRQGGGVLGPPSPRAVRVPAAARHVPPVRVRGRQRGPRLPAGRARGLVRGARPPSGPSRGRRSRGSRWRCLPGRTPGPTRAARTPSPGSTSARWRGSGTRATSRASTTPASPRRPAGSACGTRRCSWSATARASTSCSPTTPPRCPCCSCTARRAIPRSSAPLVGRPRSRALPAVGVPVSVGRAAPGRGRRPRRRPGRAAGPPSTSRPCSWSPTAWAASCRAWRSCSGAPTARRAASACS